VHVGHQGALHPGGVVLARGGQVAAVEVIDDVDAAHEADPGVHHGQFAVHAAQAATAQARADLRAEMQYLHPGAADIRQQLRQQGPAAEAIQQEPGDHAAPGGAHEGGGHFPAGGVGLEDVAFQVDFPPGGVAGGDEFREVAGAVFQQGQAVAALDHRGDQARGLSWAVRAAWSERRRQRWPCRTWAEVMPKPRT
jgi:hypothetical protein